MATANPSRRRSATKTAAKSDKPAPKANRTAASKSAAPTTASAKTSRATAAQRTSRKATAKPGAGTKRKASVSPPAKSATRDLIVAPPSAVGPQWMNRLRDGTHVLIRPIRKTDAALERTFIERLSDASRRFRFLGLIKSPSAELLKRLTDIDYRREMAFVALVHDGGEKKEIGVSRYSVAADGTSCECAVAVADEWQGRGLGALLMRHLIDVAREQGIKKMLSIDANDNTRMRDLAGYLGFKRKTDPGDARQVIYTLEL